MDQPNYKGIPSEWIDEDIAFLASIRRLAGATIADVGRNCDRGKSTISHFETRRIERVDPLIVEAYFKTLFPYLMMAARAK